MRLKKAIIFDCDGTLIDSEEAHFMSWNFALKKQNMEPYSFEEYRHFVGGAIDKTAYLFAEKREKLCPEKLIEDKKEHFISLRQKGLLGILPTVQFVRRLSARKRQLGLKLAIASAAHTEEILFHVRHLGIESAFDVILSGVDDLADYFDEEGVNKPKPYIYLEVAKRLACLPAECVVVEDSSTGVKAAVDAGCTVIAVPNKYTQNHDLSCAHLQIASFENVSADTWPFFEMGL